MGGEPQAIFYKRLNEIILKLEKKIQTSTDKQERIKAARDLYHIGKREKPGSPVMVSVANVLYTAWQREKDSDVEKEIYKNIEKLSYGMKNELLYEKIQELATKLNSSRSKEERMDAARDLYDIAKSQERKSLIRFDIGRILFNAWQQEMDPDVKKRIHDRTENLGYKVEANMTPENIPGHEQAFKFEYRLVPAERHPAQPAKARVIPKKVAKKPKAPEKGIAQEEEEKPPPHITLEPPRLKLPFGQIPKGLNLALAPDALNRIISEADEKRKKAEKRKKEISLVPLEPGLIGASDRKTAEILVSNLPRMDSPAGKEAAKRLGDLTKHARARVLSLSVQERESIYKSDRMEDFSRQHPIINSLYKPFPKSIQPPAYIKSLDMIIDVPIVTLIIGKTRKNRHGRKFSPLEEVMKRIAAEAILNGIDKLALMNILENPVYDRYDREKAASMLGGFKVREAVPLLGSILDNPLDYTADEKRFLRVIRHALFAIGNEEAIARLKKDPNNYAVTLAEQLLIQDPDTPNGRRWIEGHTKEVIGYLKGPLGFETKADVAIFLCLAGKEEGGKFLEWQVKYVAVKVEDKRYVIKQMESTAWNPKIQTILLSLAAPGESPQTRAMAAIALGGGNFREGIESLMRLADDPDATVRKNSLESLGKVAGRSDHPGLTKEEEKIGKDSLAYLKKRAAEGDALSLTVLAKQELLDGPEAKKLMAKIVQNKDPKIRISAPGCILRLAKGNIINPDEAARMILPMLDDGNKEVEGSAKDALYFMIEKSMLKDAELIKGIKKALERR